MSSIVAVAALAAAAVVVPFGPTPSAQALSTDLGFTADDLPTWQANGTVWAMAASGGTVFAGGTFSQIRPQDGGAGSAIAVSALTSFDAVTGQPGSCRPSVTLSGGTATVRALTVSPDGSTLYIGGNFSNVAGTTVGRLAALDIATCTVKSTFKPSTISSTVRSVSATASTVYFAGDFTSVASQTRQRFAAVQASNAALLPFKADAELPGRAIEVGKDGATVAIGGDFFTVNGQDSHGFAVVDATSGANVQNYPRGFIPDTSIIKGITADATGYYVGAEGTGGGVFDGSFAVDYSSFTQRWRDLCLGATQALIIDGPVVYEANHHHDCSLNANGFPDGVRVYLTANRTDVTNEQLAWRPQLNDGLGEGIGPRAFAIAKVGPTKYLWVGGEFTRVNAKAQQSLTRFASGPDTGAPAITTPIRAESLRAGEVQVSWRASYDDDDGKLTYRVYRNGAATPVATVQAESRWWSRPQVSIRDTSVTPGQTYTYRVTASDGTNTSTLSATASVKVASADVPYANAVIDDGATLYWRYDDASGRYGTDSSPSDREPNYMQGVGYRAGTNAALGDPGYAMSFDGSTGYAYSDKTAPAPSVYSVETWFKTTSSSGGKLIGYGNGQPNTGTGDTRQSGNYDRQVYMTNAGKLIFGTWVGSAATVTSPKSYNDGQWHQVVATQGSGGMSLYVDGVRVGRNGISAAQPYVGSWRVGGDNLSGWPSQPSSSFFGGQIDETAVYPTALSGLQVEQHYVLSGRTPAVNPAPADAYGAAVYGLDPDLYWRLDDAAATTATDSGRYGVTGSYSGAVSAGTPGFVPGGTKKAATFTPTGSNNGQGGVIASDTQFTDPHNYSLELWFSSTTGHGGKLLGFGDQKTNLSGSYDRHLYLQDDGKLVFGTWTGQTNTITTANNLANGQWHHVVATQSDTTGMKLYVDGALAGTNGQTGAQAYSGYWKVGGDPTWGSSWPYYDGKVDEVAVYSSVLTPTQIQQHYALGTGGTPPDATAPTAPGTASVAVTGELSADVSWAASTDDTAVTGYTLYRSTVAGFAPSPAAKVADVTATTYADTLPAGGTYYYRVTARDAAGNISDASIQGSGTVTGPDTQAPSAPAGLAAVIDGSSVKLTWSAATDDRGVAKYTVYRSTTSGFSPSAGTKVADAAGTSYTDSSSLGAGTYYYVVTASDAAANEGAASGQGSVTILGPDTQAPSAPSGLSASLGGSFVQLTWSAATDDRGVDKYTVYRSTTSGFSPSAGTKVADATGTSYTDSSSLGAGTYYYVVTASDAAGNEGAASGQDSVTILGPDTQAPSAPSSLAAVIDGSSVKLTWSAATDDRGVDKYTVYRSTTSGFSPSAGTRVADSSGTSYTDSSSLAPNRYYYVVTASDAAGNEGAASGQDSVLVVAPPADPVTVTVDPTADTMVNQSAATTQYGIANQLAVRGGSPFNAAYFKFAIPSTPAGTVLSSASLRVRTTTVASAGSVDPFTFVWADSGWDETSTLYATRPALTTTQVGTFAAASVPNTTYNVPLTASAFAGAFGQTRTLALTGTSADNVWLWSREINVASYRPQLTLTFTAP
ncbi:LamG-like jellyroll fold domain-containing protein [Cellulomonas sp. PhB150]|uniref:LamG-like jellyroll fold domain-containing protein n=1 Tax=Cellulomonas sp. PhB150 TaxID=2485188 RepID=UPI0018F6A68F|nr:LamG-like jellyroll fold domain-containing protein [Cellulomonas sp. PhB150]